MKKFFILLAIFFNILTAYAQNKKDPCYTNLDADEFYLDIHTKEVFLIDVRLFREFRAERINGAILAANKESLISLCKKLDKTTLIYVYCDENDRSVTAANILCTELGFKNVYNLRGGLNEWTKKYPIDKSKIKRKNR